MIQFLQMVKCLMGILEFCVKWIHPPFMKHSTVVTLYWRLSWDIDDTHLRRNAPSIHVYTFIPNETFQCFSLQYWTLLCGVWLVKNMLHWFESHYWLHWWKEIIICSRNSSYDILKCLVYVCVILDLGNNDFLQLKLIWDST